VITRYCCYCVPRRLMDKIDDGELIRIETDGICPECFEKEMAKIRPLCTEGRSKMEEV
jgi:hypothetical protein